MLIPTLEKLMEDAVVRNILFYCPEDNLSVEEQINWAIRICDSRFTERDVRVFYLPIGFHVNKYSGDRVYQFRNIGDLNIGGLLYNKYFDEDKLAADIPHSHTHIAIACDEKLTYADIVALRKE